jgi:TRAP-type C4-dicarboxylate transport system substrate-binding protein
MLKLRDVLLLCIGVGLVLGARWAESNAENVAVGSVYDRNTKQPIYGALVGIRNRQSPNGETLRDGIYHVRVPSDVMEFELVVKKRGYWIRSTEKRYANDHDPIHIERLELLPIGPTSAIQIRQEGQGMDDVRSERIKDLSLADLLVLRDQVTGEARVALEEILARLPTIEGPQVAWRASLWGKSRLVTEETEFLALRLSRRTKGQFASELFYEEQLGSRYKNLGLMAEGVVDMGMFCAEFVKDRAVLLTGLELPFLRWRDVTTARYVQDKYVTHPAVEKSLAEAKVRILMTNPVPPYEFIGVGSPPTTPASWRGKRIYAPDHIGNPMKRLGVTSLSQPMPMTDVVKLLAQGQLDAVALPIYAQSEFGLPGIARWYTANMQVASPFCPLASGLSAWTRLPNQYKKVMDEARRDAYSELGATYGPAEAASRSELKKNGLVEVRYGEEELKAFVELVGKPTWEAWVREVSRRGIPGKELLELLFKSAAEKGNL